MAPSQPLQKPAVYRGGEPFAFISYSHEDEALVYPEMNRLIESGVRLYFDAGIAAGHAWHDDLADAIERCQVFLLFLTPRSAVSNHCRREIHFALDLHKPVVAVHLEPTDLPGGLRLAIGDKQAILAHELDRSDYERALRQALEQYLEIGDVPAAATSTEPPQAPRTADARASVSAPTGQSQARRRRWPVTLAILAIAAVVSATWFIWQRETRHEAALARLDEAETFLQQDRYGQAFLAARPVADVLTNDPRFQHIWSEVTADIIPTVREPGVRVRMRPYEVTDADWIDLGTTPLQPVAAPRGVLLLRLEKPGFETREFAVANPGPLAGNVTLLPDAQMPEMQAASQLALEVTAPGKTPEGMVVVPATDLPIFLQGFSRRVEGDAQYRIPSFAIGRTEVSNRAYKAFVEAGGYAKAEYWSGMTLPDGAPLTLETVATFVDDSERPGPATWDLGTYPAGSADLPVGGISWYEAAAYARFRGLALPTLHHWARAAFAPMDPLAQTAPAITRTSNFESDGPQPANADLGIGPWGTVNTAGNVREWVWNRAGNQGLILGGAWSDYPSLYQDARTIDLLNRAPENGVRLMHTLGEPVDPTLLEPVAIIRDSELAKREPVTDGAFEAMRFQFTHAPRHWQSVNVRTVESNDTWTAEEVTLSSPGAEPFTLFVVTPATASRRLQPVIYMPHGGARVKAPNDLLLTHVPYLDFIVRAGRALIMPVWAGTLQRWTPPSSDPQETADIQRRASLAWYEDAATTIDYLKTRGDIDADRIGYLGNSFGAISAPIILSQEHRFSAAVLIAGGIWNVSPLHPMIDGVNYAPRVTLPVLMINGRYDHLFLVETSQNRLFDLLGTPGQDKRHLLFDSGHFNFPRHQVATEVTDWFDRYLGPAAGSPPASAE
jgi:formylglycine-generating enzyme required for sulfatase activity/dienelactone hydrolase